MDKAARIRWGVLMLMMAATIAAIIWPMEDEVPLAASPKKRSGAASSNQPQPSVQPTTELSPESSSDPFAPRGWQAPAPVAAVEAAAPMTVAPVDLTPQGPPPLPFRFVGSFNDSTEQLVYLARGEQAFVARVGEQIDGAYKVIAIAGNQIEFEHMPTNSKQTLAIPAGDN